jgi:hypothetical protein
MFDKIAMDIRRSTPGLAVYRLGADGQPVYEPDFLAAAIAMAEDDRQLGDDTINGARISTTFLGIDHAPRTSSGPPIVWETMIFGGHFDGIQERYASREDALIGHQRWCDRVRHHLADLSPSTDGAR